MTPWSEGPTRGGCYGSGDLQLQGRAGVLYAVAAPVIRAYADLDVLIRTA